MRDQKDRTLRSLGLLVLRLGAAGLLLGAHGIPKLLHFSERISSFANPIGVGPELSFILVVFAEVLCSLLVILGFRTRLAVVPILIFLTVAAFVQHLHDPWSRRELPILYMVPFLAILLAGGGRYSIDAALEAAAGGNGRRKT